MTPTTVVDACPAAWCSTCFVDLDGFTFHRSAERSVPGGRVQAFAGQSAGADLERPVCTVVTGGLDVEHTADGVRRLAAALVAFVEEVEDTN